ncbi:MAG: choice-of-anchor D domain-containing protein [Kofleriaceae bacterium]|nr:choice-of-anchor D domain-containing protein [Kofleriaceae bacterium]
MAQPTARVLVLGLLLAALEACTGPLELAQVQQDVQAVPGGVDLGTVAFGETSPSVPIRLVPDFNESLEILAITSNCGAVTVTPGALPTYIFFFNDPMFGAFYVEHVFEVQFTGLVTGTSTCLVSVAFGAAADLVIPVTGTTLPPPRELTLVQPLSGALAFGQVPVNTISGGADVIIRNDGGADLSINGAAVLGGPFMLTAGGTGALGAGQSRTFTLVCNPPVAGPASGTFRIQSDDPDEPVVDIGLSCTGITSNLTITPSPLSFAPVRVGEVSPLMPVQVGNTGGLALTVTAIALDNPAFTVGMAPALPQVVSTPNPLGFGVVFTPTVEGDATATLTVTYDGGQTRTSAVSGSGRVSTFSITPAGMVEFGPICGGEAADEVFLVLNTGSGDYRVTDLSSSAPEFVSTLVTPPTLPATVSAAGANAATFSVRATPTQVGPIDGAITVTTDIPGLAPQVVEVHATGIAAGVSATPAQLDLGTVVVGNTGSEVVAYLSNCAATAQPISGVVIEGAEASDFTLVTSPVDLMVPAQGTVGFGVRMAPTAVGPRSATLVIRHGAGETQVPLVGVGVVLDDGSGDDAARGSYYACSAGAGGGPASALLLLGLAWAVRRRRARP